MSSTVLIVLMFLLGAGGVVGAYVALTKVSSAIEQNRIKDRIQEIAAGALPTGDATVIKRALEGPVPFLDRFASQTSRGWAFATLIEQSGIRVSVSAIVVISLLLAVVLGVVVAVFVQWFWAPAIAALVGLALPTLYLRFKRRQRIRKFEEQFPEALDLLSRAIRAGHAFTTALGMAAEEMKDPSGPEFRKTFDQQNFGLPLKDALTGLMERVPLMDVRFFVTAVMIQRETGGNLSEILDNLAHVVRERFKILRQVRVYTAHGRLTGYVLMALPAALAVALSFINPEHMASLFRERMGQMMLVGAIVMQTIGYFWVRQVVKIEV